MHGKLEIDNGECKATQTRIEIFFSVWEKDKDGVETHCWDTALNEENAKKFVQKMAAHPDDYEYVFPQIASAVKEGKTLVLKRRTQITTWSDEDVMTVNQA